MTSAASPSLGLAIQGETVPMVVEAGVTAERHGFASVWTSEFYDRSAVVTLAALASATSRIGLGSSIAWAFGRTPLTLATDFRSLDELCPGRLSMGIGSGNPQVIADWHGLNEPRPVARLVETVGLIRQLWNLSETPVAHDGTFHRCHLAADPQLPPLSKGPLPILMAGGGLPLTRAAGTVADGLIGLPLASRKFVEDVTRTVLAQGAASVGRDEHVPITGLIISAVDEDAAQARAKAALQIAVYVTRSSADTVLRFHGFERQAHAVREAFGRRDFAAMQAAVTDRMLDTFAVYGTPEEARERYLANFESAYEQPLLFCSGKGLAPEQVREDVDAICETFAPFTAPLA